MTDDGSYVISLGDRVKNQIYDDFERISRQESIVLSAKGRENYIRAIKHYRTKYIRFFNNIFSTDGYPKLKANYRSKLELYRKNVNQIKKKEQVMEITLICSAVIRDMKITKISFNRSEDAL